MKALLFLLHLGATSAGSLRTTARDSNEEMLSKLSPFTEEHMGALLKDINGHTSKHNYAIAAELTDTYKSRQLIRDADRNQVCFQDTSDYRAFADFLRDPFKANNDRGDWAKCVPEELFSIMCEHEIPHMLNDGSWEDGDGPLHDKPSEELFLQMKSLHDDYCIHIDLDIPDNAQEVINDFLHGRNKYADKKDDGGDLNDVVMRVVAKSGKYIINGVTAPKLTIIAGVTYTFLVDGLAPVHPFEIGESYNDRFTDGITYNPNNVTVQLPLDVGITSLEYYCTAHPTMGNKIDVVTTPPTEYIVTAESGKYYLNGEKNPQIALIRGQTYKFDTSHSTMAAHPFRFGTRDSANNLNAGDFEEAVTLSDKGYEVAFNIGEEEFNKRFKACPVVQYTRNKRVHSVYIRKTAIPESFNPYELFTYMWSDANNTMHEDFEIYDNMYDLLRGIYKWKTCNYNDADVGYPRDCGKNNLHGGRWFSMPFGEHEAPGLELGASFHIHTSAGCPSALGPEVPYTKGVTYSDDETEATIVVPMDAPSTLTYYCLAHPTPGMGNNIIVPPPTHSHGRKLVDDGYGSDDYEMKITYDMACVQKYPNNARFALQMSLYCMTAFFSHGDVSADFFESPHEISPTCDTMMRSHKRTLASASAPSPTDFCDQDTENDTCTVRAYVRPYLGRTCRSFCESFKGLTCASASTQEDPWNSGGKCLAGREMSCDAEHQKEDYMLCTCTTDDSYMDKVGKPKSPEQPLTPSAAKLLVKPQEKDQHMFLCDQNFVNDTVKVYTSKSETCNRFCLSNELVCYKGERAEDDTCITKYEWGDSGCNSHDQNRLCTCGPRVKLDDSKVVEASTRVAEALQYDLAYKLDIPNNPRFYSSIPYSPIEALPDGLEFTRIAYYMQLIDYHGVVQWVWVSMDPFTNDISKIGVPASQTNAIFQKNVTNMNIESSLEYFNKTKYNIAIGKSTSQSSTGWGGLSARAVDGNTDGHWNSGSTTHTNYDDKAWWEVDLEGYYLINDIKVHNREDCCSDRLDNFDVIITNDGEEVWKYQQTGRALEVTDIDVPANIQGNKVKVQLRRKNYLQLAEVEVFGEPLNGVKKPLNGNIEFWPTNYGYGNTMNVKGADNNRFDWGDDRHSGTNGYGSMQVHAPDLRSTVFAFNRWNYGDSPDIGIGNRKDWNTDWTYSSTGESYQFKRIEVFVKSNSTRTRAPVNAPVQSPTKAPEVCEDTKENFCLNPNECNKKKLLKNCKTWVKEKKCNVASVKANCAKSCGTCGTESRRRRLDTGYTPKLVTLTGRDVAVKTDVGESAFNAAFEACPVVQYTHNKAVMALYMRRTPIPEGFNAYKVFTENWVDTNNVLNRDFELYDNFTSLVDQTDGWLYCNYNHGDVGFPYYCGKVSAVYNRYFRMPGRGYIPNIPKGVSFEIHSAENCPIEAPEKPEGCEKTSYLGCFKDSGDRALKHYKGSGLSVDQCINKCEGFKYAGRQSYGQCWCGDSGHDKYGETTGCDCDGDNVGGWKNCVYEFNSCWSGLNYKIVDGYSGEGSFTDAVALTGTDVNVDIDAGEAAFNAAFASCPAVEYIRNEEVYAVYRRRTPIPEGFNAYKLFTNYWDSADNLLNLDFEIYNNHTDLMNHQNNWKYCNYGYAGIGFPRDCGPTKYTGSNWFAIPAPWQPPNLKKGASLAVHSADGCPIDALVSRNNVTAVNNKACERMVLHPNNGIVSYYGSDRIVPNVPDSCTVEARLDFEDDNDSGKGSCNDFCKTFKSMTCVGAHGDPNAMFDDGEAVSCDTSHENEVVACQCAIDGDLLKEEEEYVAEPTSNACMNLAFGGDLTTHEIYEYCDSDKTTCTVNLNTKGRDTSCSEFCSSRHGMECVSASKVEDYNQRLQCKSSSPMQCDDPSTKDYLQCECGFVDGSERANILNKGPVLEKNVQEMCPAYTKDSNGRNTNEGKRMYQKVVLTLGVNDDPDADGSIPIVGAKLVRDYSDHNRDSYNTQDVEVCDGLEYTRNDEDPPEVCSFGHRYDGDSNCYGKLEMNFEQASKKCAARGGHLLRLDNEDEYNKLNKVFRRQRFSIGLHSDETMDGMEWDGYPGCKLDAANLSWLNVRWDWRNMKQNCWELDMYHNELRPHHCTDTRTYICEAHRPSETPRDKESCKSDSELGGKGGDLMADEGGFCLWYLEERVLTLPDDESGGFRNTEIAHFLAFSEETRTRKYYKEYDHLIASQEFRGHYANEANWEKLTRSSIGLDSSDPIIDIKHETDDYHCHFSPTNFGTSRIYLQQHMAERIYPGAFKKHCFCGYKHMGKLISRCDCTKNGVRNNNCQKEHRPMLYEATYKENGEYVYCNDNQCDTPSP